MTGMIGVRPLVAVFLSLCLVPGLWADTSPRAWLEAMSKALRHLDYEGELIYQQGKMLELLHLEHRVEAGEEHERLTSLNGPLREVVRDHQGARCRLPNDQSVAVGRLGAVTGFPGFATLDGKALDAFYELRFGERTRLAGQEAQGIEILPRDRLRYGFRLYLDTGHRLPLKQMMLDGRGEPLVTMMYSRLQVLPGQALAPAPEEPVAKALGAPLKPLMAQAGRDWSLGELPPGFRVSFHDVQALQGAETSKGAMEHLVLSDGLATVSLYIESGFESDADVGLEGLSRMGATGAYGRRLGPYQVTAVGEVPEAALRWIAEAVKLP